MILYPLYLWLCITFSVIVFVCRASDIVIETNLVIYLGHMVYRMKKVLDTKEDQYSLILLTKNENVKT